MIISKKNQLLLLVISIFMLLYVITLAIQINGAEALYDSKSFQVQTKSLSSSRGNFFAKNGEQLTQNKEVYEISSSSRIEYPEKIKDISNYLDKSWVEASNQREYIIIDSLKDEQLAWLSGILEDNPDMDLKIERSFSRDIIFPEEYSFVIGYLGLPNQEDILEGYSNNDWLGKYRLESILENELKGREGLESAEINVGPESGEDILLTINNAWQRNAYSNLRKIANKYNVESAAFIAVESETGKVRSYVNYPTFNANSFNQGITAEEYNRLSLAKGNPLLDKVISVPTEPGSIFKIPVSIAYLDNGVLNPRSVYFSEGCIKIGKSDFCEYGDRRLGSIDLTTAIAKSSNLYFCDAGSKGYEVYDGIVKSLLDIGISTEVEFPFGPTVKGNLEKQRRFYGDYCNTIIGQGNTLVTPIQMLNVIQYLITDGKFSQDGGYTFQEKDIESVPIKVNDNNLLIWEGMRKAVNEGTGIRLQKYNLNYHVKTGSAETQRLVGNRYVDSVHGWTIGTFDFKGKKHSFAVMLRHSGGSYTALEFLENFSSCLVNGSCSK